MSTPPALTLSGFFRSKIFFNGEYFDTEWDINLTHRGGKKGYEVIVKKCMGGQPRQKITYLNFDPDFHAKLIKRAERIRDANHNH